MLVLSRKPNQSIHIGDGIKVKITKVRGNVIQLGIEAPKSVRVMRSELLEEGSASSEKSSETSFEEEDLLDGARHEMRRIPIDKDSIPHLTLLV